MFSVVLVPCQVGASATAYVLETRFFLVALLSPYPCCSGSSEYMITEQLLNSEVSQKENCSSKVKRSSKQLYDFTPTWFSTWGSLVFFGYRARSTEALKFSEWIMVSPWASVRKFCTSTDVICVMGRIWMDGWMWSYIKPSSKRAAWLCLLRPSYSQNCASVSTWFIARHAGVWCCALSSAHLLRIYLRFSKSWLTHF